MKFIISNSVANYHLKLFISLSAYLLEDNRVDGLLQAKE